MPHYLSLDTARPLPGSAARMRRRVPQKLRAAGRRDDRGLVVCEKNERMDREQAQTHLRRLAEAELRSGTRSIGFSEAVRALTAVGAVDAELADAIGYDLELARRVRQQAP